jgi:hypothetical protein
MKPVLKILVLLLPVVASAGEKTYLCTTKQILELSETGSMEKHTGAYKQLVDRQFSVNRETGEIAGLPFSTQAYKTITVLDRGSSQNSFKAIVTSHPPNKWVIYLYVAEHSQRKRKPFWGTEDGDKIFSGYCE